MSMELRGYFTSKGIALSAKLLTGKTLEITRVAAGNGWTQENASALSQQKQELAVSPPSRQDVTVSIPAVLVAAQAPAEYSLTELGIYARDPEEGEILYKIYRLEEPVRITPTSRMVLRFYLEETVSQEVGVSVTCSPAGLVTEKDFAPVRERVLTNEPVLQTVSVKAEDLQAYVNGLPRFLTKHINICVSGELESTLWINNFFGSGSLSIYSEETDRAVFRRPVNIRQCGMPVSFGNLHFIEPEGLGNYEAMLSATYSGYIYVKNCEFSGLANGRGTAIEAGNGSVMDVVGLKASNHAAVAIAESGAVMTVSCAAGEDVHDNVRGAFTYCGGVILLVGDATPATLGGAFNSKSGGIIAAANGTLL